LVRLGKVSIAVKTLAFGGYGLALAALALVVFGAYVSYPPLLTNGESEWV